MAESKSKKLRNKEAKRLGYDAHAIRRGEKIPRNQMTKTRKGALVRIHNKERRNGYDHYSDGSAFSFFFGV